MMYNGPLNLDLNDFKKLMNKTDFEEEPVDLDTFCTDEYFLGMRNKDGTPQVGGLQKEIIERMSQIYLLDTLIELNGEREGQRLWDRTVNLVIAQLGKGCPLAGTKIWSPELGYVAVEKIIADDYAVDSLHGEGIASRPWITGVGRGMRITTNRGFSIDVYEGHRFLVGKKKTGHEHKKVEDFEWGYAKDLQIGAFVPIKTGWIPPKNPIALSPDLGRWFGYMLGDGTFPTPKPKSGSPKLTNVTAAVYEDWIKICESIPGHKVSHELSGYGADRWVVGSGAGRGTNYFIDLCRQFGLDRISYQGKRWSDDFMLLDDEVLGQVLVGLIATDGAISISDGVNCKKATIEIGMTSESILKGAQMAFARLGILAAFHKKSYKQQPHHSDVWTLTISHLDSIKKFLQDHGSIPGKEDKCADILSWAGNEGSHASYLTTGFYTDTVTKIEELGDQEYYDLSVTPTHSYLAEGFTNSNSGKDFSIRVAFCRIVYLLHCLRDPLAYYDKGKGDFIDLLNLALNAEQAKNVFFDPMKNLLGQSPYFQEKGMEFRAKEIYFLQRPIRCFSGHSGAEGWEGYNLIACVLDEIAAFKTHSELGGEKNRYSADTLYNMANNSVISRFPDVGKIALLSFPRYTDDFIQERYEASISEKKVRKITQVMGQHEGKDVEVSWEDDEIISYAMPKVWALKAPSFYINPQRKIEDYLSSYISNPVETLGRFFCQPPKAVDAYFRDPDRVRICFPEDDELNPIDEFGRFKKWFQEDDMEDGPKRFVHIDLGLNRDRAGLCMVHAIGAKTVSHFDGVLTTTHKLPVIKMDIINYWEAPPGGEIDFNDIRQFIFNLADRFPIVLVSMDRWNSQDTSKILQSRGLSTEMHTVVKEDYDTLSTSIYDARLIAYHHDILVEQELLKLQLIKGKKVDHPRQGYKDGSDCLAGSVWYCTQYTPIDDEMEIDVLGGSSDDDRDEDENIIHTNTPAKRLPSKKSDMPPDISEFLERMKAI